MGVVCRSGDSLNLPLCTLMLAMCRVERRFQRPARVNGRRIFRTGQRTDISYDCYPDHLSP